MVREYFDLQWSDWPEMDKGRGEAVRDRIGVEVKPSYEFGPNNRLHRLKLQAGYKNPDVPFRGDGPMLVLTRPYPYRQRGGAPKPITQLPLFTITDKMSCLSYSLPAGPVGRGKYGSCAMADSAVALAAVRLNADARGKAELRVQFAAAPDLPLDSIRPFRPGPAEGSLYICDVCYAGKSRYLLFNDQAMKAVWRHAWTRAALKKDGGEFFVREIVKGIEHFRALPRWRGPGGRPPVSQESLGINANYFRWHDAGDVFSFDYWEAIKEIARRLPKVRFWVPTRQWVSQRWREQFIADVDPKANFPKNLIIRPSALFVNGPAPQLLVGRWLKHTCLAAGTMVSTEPVGSLRVHRQEVGKPFLGPSRGIFDPERPRKERVHLFPERRTLPISADEVVDCPAYLGDTMDDRNCHSQGCRVCWTRPEVAVSYDAH